MRRGENVAFRPRLFKSDAGTVAMGGEMHACANGREPFGQSTLLGTCSGLSNMKHGVRVRDPKEKSKSFLPSKHLDTSNTTTIIAMRIYL